MRIFKLALYKVIGPRTITCQTLKTFTTEFESTLNAKPLTNVYPTTLKMICRSLQITFYSVDQLQVYHLVSSSLQERLFRSLGKLDSCSWIFLESLPQAILTRSAETDKVENFKFKLETKRHGLIARRLRFRGFWPLVKVVKIFRLPD